LVGDFTGMIGDPTDKTSLRPQLTRKQVLENCKNWKEQASRVLNFNGKNPAQFLYNSQWLSKISFTELLNLGRHLTYQQTIKREMFRKRLKQDKDIYLHEFLYPLMQGYDSVHLNVDLEIGGSDQMFNMLVGRDLMKKLKNKEKFVLTTKLLVDSKGEKVGKTTGNALFLNASPNEMYGGIMSFPDEVIPLSFELLTLLPLQSIKSLGKELNPMDLKKKLAFEIVKMYYSEKEAKEAQENFEKVFQKKELPQENILVHEIKPIEKEDVIKVLTESGLASSKSEAKRLIAQGGVDVDGKTIKEISEVKLEDGSIIKAGKKKFLKIKIEK